MYAWIKKMNMCVKKKNIYICKMSYYILLKKILKTLFKLLILFRVLEGRHFSRNSETRKQIS